MLRVLEDHIYMRRPSEAFRDFKNETPVVVCRCATPTRPNNAGPGSLEELDALAQEETCEISQRMREAQPSLYGTGLASDTGSTDHLDTMTSGWRGDTHSDGTTAPAAATATPTATRRPATESDLGRPISRLGAAIAEALVPVNPTVRDAPRRWWAVRSRRQVSREASLSLSLLGSEKRCDSFVSRRDARASLGERLSVLFPLGERLSVLFPRRRAGQDQERRHRLASRVVSRRGARMRRFVSSK